MSIDFPNGDIQQPVKEPLTREVFSVGECKLPDSFQNQFDDLVADSKKEKERLQGDLKYSENEKEALRNIYCSLGSDNPELKKAIEKQTINFFRIPGKDLLALHKKNGNILYISESNGDFYFNLEVARESIFAKALKMLYKTQNNIDEVFNESESRYEYYKDGNKINSLSDEHINMLLMAIKELKTFGGDVIEEGERRRKLGIIKE